MELSKDELLIAAVFILIYAFLVRGWMVGEARDFWHDEAFQYEFSLMPVTYILDSNDVHPPLFTLLTKFMIQGLGIADPSYLRFVIVGISILFLASLAFVVYKLWGAGEALISLVLASFLPTFVYYSTEFRSYAFTLLIVIWQIYAFNLMLQSRKKAGIWFVILSVLMIYTHYMAALVLAAQFVYLVIAREKKFWLQWSAISVSAIPLLIYIARTLPKIYSFWFKDIGMVSLISTFSYLITPPTQKIFGWSLLIYGVLFGTYWVFRHDLTKKHLQFGLYLVLPVITMWFISQFFPFYHHRYFLFGGMALFPLVSWGVMRWSKKKDADAELAFMAMVGFMAFLSLPYLVDNNYNHEIWDSAAFIYNHTRNGTEEGIIVHTSPFSQTPYKVLLPGSINLLYTNLSKKTLFTAGGAVIRDYEMINDTDINANVPVYYVSDKPKGEILWSEGGLYVCRLEN